MAYCTVNDLYAAFGEENVQGWSRFNPAAITRAIEDAQAEIDGYLLSGGYTVPLTPCPKNVKKYATDLAGANLLLHAGLLSEDSGGAGHMEQAKVARRWFEKVAEGKFRIPKDTEDEEQSSPEAGGIRVSAMGRLDLKGY